MQFFNNFSMKQDAEQREGVVLTIHSGLLSGSERYIDKNSFLIGSSASADIILLDEGVAPVHFAVVLTRSMLGLSISIRAIADGVTLPDKVLAIEETVHIQNKAEITIAGIELTIQDAKNLQYSDTKKDTESVSNEGTESEETGELAADSKKSQPHIALAVVSVLFLGTGAFLYGSKVDVRDLGTNANWQDEKPDKLLADKILTQLRGKLQDAGLNKLIQVSKRTDDTLEVMGNLKGEQLAEWLAILQWYDTQQKAPTLRNLINENPRNENYPKIKYVWFGEDPYVVLQNNQKVAAGETLASGWKIETVDYKGVLISTEDRRIMIKFE